MIFNDETLEYFNRLPSLVANSFSNENTIYPYQIKEDIIEKYECIRKVWVGSSSVKQVYGDAGISRATYYSYDNSFASHGLLGLFPHWKEAEKPEGLLERLTLLIKDARPSLSQQGIFRISQSIPVTKEITCLDKISQILKSHGLNVQSTKSDKKFWGNIQRRVKFLNILRKNKSFERSKNDRKKSFFCDADKYHRRLEMLRELSFNNDLKVKDAYEMYAVNRSTYYNITNDYHLFGPWAIIPARDCGKGSNESETELSIILHKLKNPCFSGADILKTRKLKISRQAIDRILKRWGLLGNNFERVSLDEYIGEQEIPSCNFTEFITAKEKIDDAKLLDSYRMNRHFSAICGKMRHREFNICDPGPIILAPFVNALGVMEALEVHGPTKSRGEEISNLILLNVFRIIAGYKSVDHLSDNADRSVAFASGIGMFGSSSRYYNNTLDFSFEHLHMLKLDLLANAKHLGIVKGERMAFDFKLKEFYGSHSYDKFVGKGPDKAGNQVPAFRPHLAWDLDCNNILNLTFFNGGKRAGNTLQNFCEDHLFSVLDPLAVKEIYMDSEYTKEGLFQYLKVEKCFNGELYVCLKRNKQIEKIIKPALELKGESWVSINRNDEYYLLKTNLPNTKLFLSIMIIRNKENKKNIRCFASTKDEQNDNITEKYPFRWLIENGIKDLVYSYSLENFASYDPKKMELELYCVMIAKMAYELFLKTLEGKLLCSMEGNKKTLGAMRHLLFEKRNCTISLDENKDFLLTFKDTLGIENSLGKQIADLFSKMKKEGENNVLWWNDKGLVLNFENQYQ